ncbi:hypothetical protein ACHAPJ_008315 [Fusarium lateritium]
MNPNPPTPGYGSYGSGGEGSPAINDHPIIHSRCGLCRFKFEDIDDVIIFTPRNSRWGPIWNGKYARTHDPAHHGPTFVNFPEKGYHQDCAELFWPDLTMVDSSDEDIFNATGYGSDGAEPPSSFEASRVKRLQESFALKLHSILNSIEGALHNRFPPEICQYFASYFLRERAVQIVRDLWMEPGHPKPKDANLVVLDTRSYWVQYVEIEGLQYVKSLSGRRQSAHDKKLFTAAPDASLNFYFGSDSLGIRKIIVKRNDKLPKIFPRTWLTWVVYRHQKAPFWFRMNYDGIKLRRLAITYDAHDNVDCLETHWAAFPRDFDSFPRPPRIARGQSAHRHYAVYAVDWNSPEVCGYSFTVNQE